MLLLFPVVFYYLYLTSCEVSYFSIARGDYYES
ncbi:Uncharacterised protein [Yersinia frederiksenii]|nr:Uncharacterised protein [Yersinia frederiksenii]